MWVPHSVPRAGKRPLSSGPAPRILVLERSPMSDRIAQWPSAPVDRAAAQVASVGGLAGPGREEAARGARSDRGPVSLGHNIANLGRKMVGRYPPHADGVRQSGDDTGPLEGPTPTVRNSANDKAGDLSETHIVQASDLNVPRCQVRNCRAAFLPAYGVPIVPQVFFLKPNEINRLYLIGSGRERQNDVHELRFFSRSTLPERQRQILSA